ncbi:MAG: hypothetical protein J7M34_00755 [Anaerolineae bacterium]|nr:hypothetical protein [Anaerolineae bacterium]
MSKRRILASILAIGVLMALTMGLGQAQGTEPPQVLQAQEPAEAAVTVSSRIPIQGRLTNGAGVPLNGNYDIRMRLYGASSGGAALCEDTDTVTVSKGLFHAYMDHCSSSDISGQRLYLGIKVESDPEMTPRQPIYPIPYAWSLRPGAIIKDARDVVLKVQSTGSGDSDAFIADASGTGEAIEAYAKDGIGVFAKSDTFVALQAYSYDNTNNPAIFGCSAGSAAACDPYRDDAAAGVMGFGSGRIGVYGVSHSTAAIDPPGPGVYGISDTGDGVRGKSNSTMGRGVYARNTGGGIALYGHANSTLSSHHFYPTLYLVQEKAGGDFIVGASSLWGTRYWRVNRNGKGFFNGGTQSSGADFAEQMAVTGEELNYEPGDVLVISPDADRTVELASHPFDTTVIGVYSTQPAVLAGAPDTDGPLAGIPVAITGIVPCKVSAENGPIHRGDLLVTSSTPGRAMKAGANPPPGTVLGKALGELEEGTGTLDILVSLH